MSTPSVGQSYLSFRLKLHPKEIAVNEGADVHHEREQQAVILANPDNGLAG
jgi:hypothetical protein